MEKILAQGAEAVIILSNDFVIKDRIKKSYRLKNLMIKSVFEKLIKTNVVKT